MSLENTMTERDFYAAVRESANSFGGAKAPEPDLNVDGLDKSFLRRLLNFFTGRWD